MKMKLIEKILTAIETLDEEDRKITCIDVDAEVYSNIGEGVTVFPSEGAVTASYLAGNYVYGHQETEECTDREVLAEQIHDEWMEWATEVYHDIPESTQDIWNEYLVPYSELPEEAKKSDRDLADKIIALGFKRD